jgi:hypothetical protein
MRYYPQFQIHNFLANLSPKDLQIPHLFSDMFCKGIRFTSMALSFPYNFCLEENWCSLWDYNTSIFKTLSSSNFNILETNKLLVLMHIIFSSHTCSGSQTISELCILTIKFTCSKIIYHSFHFGSVGKWSSLWVYNTAISNTLFFL